MPVLRFKQAGVVADPGDMEENALLPDLAEALQARILAHLRAENIDHAPCACQSPDESSAVGALESRIAMLEHAVAKAKAMGNERRQQAQEAAKRVAALETYVAKLEEAVAKAEALSEQKRREAQAASKRADDLVAGVTSELVDMSKRMAEQTAAADRLRSELEEHRLRSSWWQHSTGIA